MPLHAFYKYKQQFTGALTSATGQCMQTDVDSKYCRSSLLRICTIGDNNRNYRSRSQQDAFSNTRVSIHV